MKPYLTAEFGNPGSLHAAGRRAKAAVDAARQQVADFMGAQSPEQIIFTSGGTEGNNLVFYGLRKFLRFRGKPAILTTAIEHDSVLNAARRERQEGAVSLVLRDAPGPNGIITVEGIQKEIDRIPVSADKIGLISVMSANNELGTLNPVYGICRLAHECGALFHTDAVQAAGMYPLNAETNEYDFVTISSHKIHGPKGVGALYARDPTQLSSLIVGGSHQEFGLRGGTENVAGIVGFGAACELLHGTYEERMTYRASIVLRFLCRLLHDIAFRDRFNINGCPPPDAKTLSLRFDGLDAQSLLLLLDSQGICVSAGSACTAHEDTPSHVLLAIGLTPEQARSSIRVSFSESNTMDDAEHAAAVIASSANAMWNLP